MKSIEGWYYSYITILKYKNGIILFIDSSLLKHNWQKDEKCLDFNVGGKMKSMEDWYYSYITILKYKKGIILFIDCSLPEITDKSRKADIILSIITILKYKNEVILFSVRPI